MSQGMALWTPVPMLASAPQVSLKSCSLEGLPHRDRNTADPKPGAGLLDPWLPWAGSCDLVPPKIPPVHLGSFLSLEYRRVCFVASGRRFGASWVLIFGCPCPALRTGGLGGFVHAPRPALREVL